MFVCPRLSAFLPEIERPLARHVEFELLKIDSLTVEVEAAVVLYLNAVIRCQQLEAVRRTPAGRNDPNLAHEMTVAHHWPFIAARSVPIAIDQFKLLKGNINALWRKVPTLLSLIDASVIKRSNRLFIDYFGTHTEMLRDAVCHAQELSKTPESLRENSVIEPDQTYFIQAMLAGSMLQYTKEGKRYELDISLETVRRLAEVRDVYMSAFRGAEQTLIRRAQGRE